ncbi:MAG: hypothetical protein HY303_09235, partial [Candidatus Wallbacteria bacterium]|nr:hypothetical protein [Candidatus Wallbacteria bacterium]
MADSSSETAARGAGAPAPASKDAAPGQKLLKGKYEILESIAETERCFVFRGRLLPEGGDIAIKILKERFARDPAFLERYQAELRTTAALPPHPSLLRYHDIDVVAKQRFCIVMEYFPEPALEFLAIQKAAIPYPLLLSVMRQLDGLLEFGHREGLMQRIVRLEDVLVRASDRAVRLTRFGSPRAAGTRPGGTNQKPTSTGPDLLFLGVTLFRLVTGLRYPHGQQEVPEVLAEQLSEAAKVRYSEITGDEVSLLSKLFIGLTSRDFSRRIESYDGVAAALDELEKKNLAVQEERRRLDVAKAREEDRASHGSAYDAVQLLTGRGARPGDDAALRELSRAASSGEGAPREDLDAEPGGHFSLANLAIGATALALVAFVFWLF